MKKITLLLVIIFTFLFSTTSWGEWIFSNVSLSGYSYYYDKDRVRKRGEYIYFWQLIDIKKPKKEILSMKTYLQLDCSIFRSKSLNIKVYKKRMGEGESIDYNPPDEWYYPPPGSSSEVHFNKVCEEHQ